MGAERVRERCEILCLDVDDAAARAIDIRDQKKRNGQGDGEDESEKRGFSVCVIAKKQIAEDGDGDEKSPSR